MKSYSWGCCKFASKHFVQLESFGSTWDEGFVYVRTIKQRRPFRLFCGNTLRMCLNACKSLIKGLEKNAACAVLTKAYSTHIRQQLQSRFLR